MTAKDATFATGTFSCGAGSCAYTGNIAVANVGAFSIAARGSSVSAMNSGSLLADVARWENLHQVQ